MIIVDVVIAYLLFSVPEIDALEWYWKFPIVIIAMLAFDWGITSTINKRRIIAEVTITEKD